VNRLFFAVTVSAFSLAASADVVTDGSVGMAGSLTGPAFTIPENLGFVSGANLLHSFSRFSIGAGESATFTTTSALQNVIARVTGGEASLIEGLVTLAPGIADTPAFFFINPAGIVISGAGGFDVPGALTLSTAERLPFQDGSELVIAATSVSSLSVASPEAFGFLGPSSRDIVITGAATPFSVGPLLGPDVDTGGAAPGPELRLQARDITIQNSTVSIPSEEPTNNYGVISISAGRDLFLNDSSVTADSSNTGPIDVEAGVIGIDAGRDVLLENDSVISANNGPATSPSGLGGEITISARNLTVLRSAIETVTDGAASAGNVGISLSGDLTLSSAGDTSATLPATLIRSDTFGAGNAGQVTVNAANVIIDGGSDSVFTGIASSSLLATPTSPSSVGAAGQITVVASGNITVSNLGQIASNTFTDGDAGAVTVTAGGDLIITNEGIISSDVYGVGNGGLVTTTGRRVVVDGTGTDGFTGISSDALDGTGDAGFLIVQATEAIEVLNGGQISSITQTSGRAGNILTYGLDAENDFAALPSFTPVINVGGSGPAGVSRITAQATETSTGGVGGLFIIATRLVRAADDGEINVENFASSMSTTPDGLLLIEAPTIQLDNAPFGASSASFGNLPAVPITIIATRRLFLNDSRIITEAVDGNGGTIAIESPVAFLQNSQITTSVTGTTNGNGGDIFVTAGKLILDTGFILANTAAPSASGGLVGISVGDLFVSSQSLLTGGSTPVAFLRNARGLNVIQAAAPDGVNGEIILDAPPTIDVTGSLLALQAPRIGDIRISRDPCDNRSGSSLVAFGRGGPPCSALDPLRQR
jgi:filamentous hemagglutinin family protein